MDCSKSISTLRPLHGVNGGVLSSGETVDLTDYWKEAAIPSTRLHDCEWPAPVVVDIHAIFPDFIKDSTDPASYRFAQTDTYLAAIIASGTDIIYRLGESIEHSRNKYYVNPPDDPKKWADICLHIIKHYNEGWADGFHYGIKYWEIWNEPENRPAMWTGTDEQFFELYHVTAKTLKTAFPELKIGGPSTGWVAARTENGWKISQYAEDFLQSVKQDDVPLDFFSWHTYTNQPYEYVEKAFVVREYLDRLGLNDTEIHLNEWNYLPDNDWGPMLATGWDAGKKREQWYQRVGGAEGAGFLASVLIELQDAPVDVGNYYSGDINGFGLFKSYGNLKKTYYAVKAFGELLKTPHRLHVTGSVPNACSVAAGINQEQTTVSVLIGSLHNTNEKTSVTLQNFPWIGVTRFELFRVDDVCELEKTVAEEIEIIDGKIQVELDSPESSVLLLRFFHGENPQL